MLVEAKYVVKYTETDGWGYDTWEVGFDSEEDALEEVDRCNKPGNIICAEYLGLKIVNL